MTMKAKILLIALALLPAALNAEEMENGRHGEDGNPPRLQSSVSSALGESNAASVVAETLLADGTTNAWTQADLVDALGLLNRRYRRDIQTDSGRRAWHGRETAQALVTNAAGRLALRRTYADGFTYDEEARARTPREAASNAVARMRASLPEVGVPPRLAARRAEAAANAGTAETNVTVTAGGPVGATPRWTLHRDAWGNVTNHTPAEWTRACWQDAPDGSRFLRQEVYDATGGLVRATCRAVAGPSAAAAKGEGD